MPIARSACSRGLSCRVTRARYAGEDFPFAMEAELQGQARARRSHPFRHGESLYAGLKRHGLIYL